MPQHSIFRKIPEVTTIHLQNITQKISKTAFQPWNNVFTLYTQKWDPETNLFRASKHKIGLRDGDSQLHGHSRLNLHSW